MSSPVDAGAERLTRHHALMWRIRAFEEAALRALDEKLVLGAIHPSIGQEAVAVGVCNNLRRDDVLLSTHRGHGHTLAKGADPAAMMLELFGRAGGICKGKGGSMHIADFGVGMLGANGVVGANISIATGAAHAIKLRGSSQIVACCFGDGAINRGPFLEGLNWAKVFQLPVLFVCEDNGFAATTRTPAMTAGSGAGARAASLDIPVVEVDGNDVMVVDGVARSMMATIRAGSGPQLLLAHTYRLSGHTGSDPASYRSEGEVAERWQQEPITRARQYLEVLGVDAAQLDAAQHEAEAEMTTIYQRAANAPWPDAHQAFSDVQDVGDPRTRAY